MNICRQPEEEAYIIRTIVAYSWSEGCASELCRSKCRCCCRFGATQWKDIHWASDDSLRGFLAVALSTATEHINTTVTLPAVWENNIRRCRWVYLRQPVAPCIYSPNAGVESLFVLSAIRPAPFVRLPQFPHSHCHELSVEASCTQ